MTSLVRCADCRADPGPEKTWCPTAQRHAGGRHRRKCARFDPKCPPASELLTQIEDAGLGPLVADLQDAGPRQRALRLAPGASDAERWRVYEALGIASKLEPVRIKQPKAKRPTNRQRRTDAASGSGGAA